MKMTHIDFVVLSKSLKNKGYCVVGINVRDRKLIRLIPLCSHMYRSINKNSLNCIKNNKICQVEILDLIRIRCVKYREEKIQKENYIVEERYVEYLGKCNESIIPTVYKSCFNLFGSTGPTINHKEALAANHSIEVIPVTKVKIYERKISFVYKNNEYESFSITDPIYRGTYGSLNKAWLVISIPEECYNVDGLYHIIVAAIIERKIPKRTILTLAQKQN